MASYEAVYWALPEEMSRESRRRLASLATDVLSLNMACYDCADWCLTSPKAHETALTQLRAMHALGVEVAARRDGTLAIRDPEKVLTTDQRLDLDGDRDHLLTLLRFGPTDELTPSEIARSRPRQAAGTMGDVQATPIDPSQNAASKKETELCLL